MKALNKNKEQIGIVPFRLFNYKDNEYFIYGKTLIGTLLYATKVVEEGNKITLSKPNDNELENLYEAVNNVINSNIYDITFFDVHKMDNKKIQIISEQPMDLSIEKYNIIVNPLSVTTDKDKKAISISKDVIKDKKFVIITYMVIVLLILASILLCVLIFKNFTFPKIL